MANSITIPDPELADLGPAMRALTPKQRHFVLAYFHVGKRERAAFMAGYAGEEGSNKLGVSAYVVWHHPKVQAAIKEHASGALVGMLPGAIARLHQIMQDGGDKDGLKAIQLITDRTGFHATTEMKVTHVDESREDTIREIVRMAREQGLDPRVLIGGAADFIDADFTVLAEAEPVVSSLEGLEDIA